MYGIVYEALIFGKKSAVKQIPFNHINSSSVIHNTIKEFCIMKLMSAF